MSRTEEQGLEAPRAPLAPGVRARSLIALLLRFGFGLQLLNAGATGFYINQMNQVGTGSGVPGFSRMGAYPGTEAAFEYLPYFEIVTALALLLGFLTTAAAVIAAVEVLVPLFFQVGVIMGAGLSTNRYDVEYLLAQSSLNATMVLNLFLASAVIWFSTSECNLWSLDALMFSPFRRAPRRAGARPGDDQQALVAPAPLPPAMASKALLVEFDPTIIDDLPPTQGDEPAETLGG